MEKPQYVNIFFKIPGSGQGVMRDMFVNDEALYLPHNNRNSRLPCEVPVVYLFVSYLTMTLHKNAPLG